MRMAKLRYWHSDRSRYMVWRQSWSFEFLSALRLRLFRCGTLAVVAYGLWLGPVAEALGSDAAASGQELGPKASDADYNPTNGLGSWIWAAQTFDRQNCQFWRTFEIPAGGRVIHARLVMTVDNEFTLYLDGRDLGRGAEWRELFDYDVTHLMSPGTHVLAVKAYNSSFYAGMIFGLRVDLADGKLVKVKSDRSWRMVPDGTKG